MKKILALLLVLSMCLSLFTGCNRTENQDTQPTQSTQATTDATDPTETTPEADAKLDKALEYLRVFYKSAAEKTPMDYKRLGQVRIGTDTYAIVWSVDVDENIIKIVENKDGTFTIDINEKAVAETTEPIPYVLTATITGTDGREVTLTWKYVIPAAIDDEAIDIIKAAYALQPGQSLDGTHTLTGKIISIDTMYDAGYKNITVTIEVGGAENMPIKCYRLKGEGAEKLAVGDTITVTGTLTNYNGEIEFAQGCVLDAVESGGGTAPVAPENPAEILEAAFSLAPGKSLPYPCTLTGTITSVDYAYDANYDNITVTMSTYGYGVKCYRLKGVGVDQLNVNDVISVYGVLTNYNGIIEFGAGCQLVGLSNQEPPVEAPDPTPDTTLSIAEAIAVGGKKQHNAYTAGKYYITGVISEVYNTTYGNMYVTDGVNTITIYGTWSADGSTRYDGLATPPVAGDTVTLYGVLGQYGNTPQMKNAWIVSHNSAGGGTGGSGDQEEEKPAVPGTTLVTEIVAGTPYKFGMAQGNLENKTFYLTGKMSGYYMATTEDPTAAVDVYVEATEGGYYCYILDGETKVYINMVVSGEHVNGAFEATPSTVYTYDATAGTLIATVNDAPYWFGTRNDKTYTTMGPCKTEYEGFYGKFYTVSEETPDKPVDPDQPADPEEPAVPGTTLVTEIVAGTPYKFGMAQGNLENRTFYITGKMSSYYMATTEDPTAAADVYVEATEGGYYCYILDGETKVYINMVVSGEHVNGAFEAAPSTVYTYDATAGTLIATVNDAPYWFGTRNDKTYTTMGPCKTEYEGFYGKFYTVSEETPDKPVDPDTPDVPDKPVDPDTPDEPVNPGEPDVTLTEKEIADGVYMIYTNDLTFAALAKDKTYGYPGAHAVDAYDESDAITVKNVDGGITIQDCYGRYIYMKGTYTSFNVSADVPAEGHVWKLMTDGTNTYLVNALMNKTLAYSTQYASWGAYADDALTENHLTALTIVTYVEKTPEPDVPDDGNTKVDVSIADYADAEGWANGIQYKTLVVDRNVTVTATGGDNTGKYYTSGENWRIYQTENPAVVVKAAEGVQIVSVKITYTPNKDGVLTLNGENIASGTVVDVNAPSVTFGVGNTGTETKGQVRITEIEVVYSGEGTGEPGTDIPDEPDTPDVPVVPDGVIVNWGSRGNTATSPSSNAEAFYTVDYNYDVLKELAGSADLSAVSGSELYQALHTLMESNHTTYTTYEDVRYLFPYTDCVNGSTDKVSFFYTGTSVDSAWDKNFWSREHCWPKSLTVNDNADHDLMTLRPETSAENSKRGNKPYGENVGYNPNTASGGAYDLRGDVARIVLYTYVRWEQTNITDVIESIDLLLNWMAADPVDTWELGRNDSVQSITGTRNVFVDYPELAFLLFGKQIPTDMVTPSGEAGKADTPVEPDTAPVVGVPYNFGMVQGNLENKTFYLTGEMDGFYLATTEDPAAAAKVYVEETEGGYYFYTMSGDTKLYINMVVSGTYVNGAFEAAPSTVYTYDATAGTLIATVNGAPYWFGTRNDKTYDTMGPCKTEYNGFYATFYPASEETPDEPDTPDTPDIPDTPVDPEEGNTAVSVSIADYAAANGWANGVMYNVVNLNEQVSVTASGTNNTGKYYTNGNEWRIYQTETPAVAVSAAEGVQIVSVKITYTSNKGGVLTLNGSNIDSGAVVDVNAASVTFGVGNTGSANNGQVKITAIEVVYSSNTSGSEPDTPDTPDVPDKPVEPDTPDEPVTPDEPDVTLTEKEIADGVYMIYTNDLTFAALAEDKTYGYPGAHAVDAYDESDAITVKNVDGGITIQDCYGRYIYMKGTYTSFNVSADAPAEGHVWKLMTDGTNTYLVNALMNKTLAYSTQYASWGAYADDALTENHLTALTIVTYVEKTPEPDVPDDGNTKVDVSIADYAAANGWANSVMYNVVNLNEQVSVTASGTNNTGKYYTNGNEWRIYQNETPAVVVSAAEGVQIVSVKITYNSNKNGVLTLNGSNIESGAVVDVNASSVTFGVGNTGSANNGQVRITAIEVIYSKTNNG